MNNLSLPQVIKNHAIKTRRGIKPKIKTLRLKQPNDKLFLTWCLKKEIFDDWVYWNQCKTKICQHPKNVSKTGMERGEEGGENENFVN